MALRIEDYALIGDTQTAALVGKDGSIDWLCFPRFDSDACFAALLGSEGHGRWLIRPEGRIVQVRRRYLPDTLILETELETEDGTVRLLELMPPRQVEPDTQRAPVPARTPPTSRRSRARGAGRRTSPFRESSSVRAGSACTRRW